jgi:hypothetical protein
MDPNACLKLIAEYIEARYYYEARITCRELEGWLTHGGFQPDWIKHPRAAAYFFKHVCRPIERAE